MISRICITITTIQIQTPSVRTSVSPEQKTVPHVLSKKLEDGTTNRMNIYTLDTNIHKSHEIIMVILIDSVPKHMKSITISEEIPRISAKSLPKQQLQTQPAKNIWTNETVNMVVSCN